jgi:putative ABC transport system permease protein
VGTLFKLPFRLRYYPGVALAAVAAALILTLTTTSTKLFVAAAGEAVLRQQLADAPTDPPLSINLFNSEVDPSSLRAADDDMQRIVLPRAPRLGRGVLTVLGVGVDVLRPDRRKVAHVQLASRTGFADHVRPLQRLGGEGVWLTDTTARELGVRAGQTILIRNPRVPPVRARVAGIYRDLAHEPPARYWGTLFPDIYPNPITETEPPPLLLAAPQTLGEIGKAIHLVTRFEWDFYLPAGSLTLEDVAELTHGIQLVDAALSTSAVFQNATLTTPLPAFLDNARGIQTALSAPVEAVSLSGRALALGLAAAVGFYMVRRRRSEFMVLAAQGVGGARLGVRAMAEAVLPVVLGGLAGWELALVLGRHLNPSPVVSAAVVRAAAWEVGLMLAAGLLLIGVATVLVSRYETRERVGRIPGVFTWPLLWEALALLLAGAALYEVTIRGGATVQGNGQIPRVDWLLMLFPLLLIGGLAGLAGRAAGRVLADRLTSFGRLPPVLFLALRRLAAAPRMALLLLTASAVSLGLLSYAGILATSTRATALAKARVAVGSDARVVVPSGYRLPASSRLPATRVVRVPEGHAFVDPGQVQIALLEIDPSSFARGAFWDRSFASRSLGGLLRHLDHPRPGRLAAIAAGGPLPPEATLTMSNAGFPLDVVSAKVFPGMPSDRPLVVVSRSALVRSAVAAGLPAESAGGTVEVWAKQDVDTLRRELGGFAVSGEQSDSAAMLLRTPSFRVMSWALGMLEALGVLAGLVTVAGLLLYVQARQRGQVVAYALVRRMGLARWRHRLSTAFELAGMLLLALALGALFAWLAAALVNKRIDLAPQFPPEPVLRLPMALFGQVLLALPGVAFAGAALVQWRADRTNVAEVMRLAG